MAAIPTDPTAGPAAAPADDAAGWKKDKQGRYYTPAKGRSGVVYRQGNETVEEAHTRDAQGPKDEKPSRRRPPAAETGGPPPGGKSKGPPPSTKDMKALEAALADALKAPAMATAMVGDDWATEHFMTQGPQLARRLTVAAEHNPWLRAKLEAMLAGEDVFMKFMTTMSLGGAVVAYVFPPLVYFTNPRFVPEQAREMFGIPARKPPAQEEPPRADPATPPPAPSTEAPHTAAA